MRSAKAQHAQVVHESPLLTYASFIICPSCTRVIAFSRVVILLGTRTETLRVALFCRHVFTVGVSHYGVADCELLAQDTHKFESRYLDSLIGCVNPIPSYTRLSCCQDRHCTQLLLHLFGCVLLRSGILTDSSHFFPSNRGWSDVWSPSGGPADVTLFLNTRHSLSNTGVILPYYRSMASPGGA